MPRPGAALRIAWMICVMNRMRCSSESAVLAGSRRGAEHLVPEIAVARLRVHELISACMREPRRRRVIVDDALDLGVCQHAHAAGESSVENGMVTRRERRRFVPHIRPREAPGVRNLQSEIQIAVGVRPKSLAMRRNQVSRKPAIDACVAGVSIS